MKNSKLVSCLGILVVSGMLGCSVAQPSHQAFLNRTGETIEVSINGTPSKRTELKRWRDVTDTEVEQTHWLRRTSSGRLCFNVKPRTEEFGAFRQMGISIKEFRPDRPSTRWKNYLIKPRPTRGHQAKPNWLPGQDFCPQEYFLTGRQRYRALPLGSYLITVRYQGEKNWDAQSILVEVEQ